MKVEMMGTEAERTESKRTEWRMQHGARTVRVVHRHTTLRTPVFHVARLGRTGIPTGESAIVTSRDFGDVLRVVRDMLGVKP